MLILNNIKTKEIWKQLNLEYGMGERWFMI